MSVTDSNDAEAELHASAVDKIFEVCIFVSKHQDISLNTVLPSTAPAPIQPQHPPESKTKKIKTKTETNHTVSASGDNDSAPQLLETPKRKHDPKLAAASCVAIPPSPQPGTVQLPAKRSTAGKRSSKR